MKGRWKYVTRGLRESSRLCQESAEHASWSICWSCCTYGGWDREAISHRRREVYNRRWRTVCGLAGVDAGSKLAMGDEGCGALLEDDLEVVGATGMRDIDGRRRPVSEDDGLLFLS